MVDTARQMVPGSTTAGRAAPVSEKEEAAERTGLGGKAWICSHGQMARKGYVTTPRESEKLQVGEDLKYHWSAIPENEGSGFQTVLSKLQCSMEVHCWG